MKYFVMECHPGYAVVIDQEGRFLRVANQHFQVGQQVDTVIPMADMHKSASKAMWRSLAAVAACLCLLVAGAWQMLMPYGAVRIQINPDVKLTVNRLDYVLQVQPLNRDAEALLQGFEPGRQKLDQVADALADRAATMGYLKEGAQIQVTVQSRHESWQAATQERLITQLQLHIQEEVTVIPNPDPIPEPEDWDEDDDDDEDDEDDEDDFDDENDCDDENDFDDEDENDEDDFDEDDDDDEDDPEEEDDD